MKIYQVFDDCELVLTTNDPLKALRKLMALLKRGDDASTYMVEEFEVE
jgi:hypothetical protein